MEGMVRSERSIFGTPNSRYRGAVLASLLLLTAAAATSCVPVATASPNSPGSTAGNAGPVVNAAIAADESTLVSLYEKNIPAVVMIEVTVGGSSSTGPFGFGAPARGQGSGFLIDNNGNILTNNHVVEDATKIRVVLHNGKTLDAQVVGTDAENDLALVKVDPQGLSGITPLTLGDSDALKPGQTAIALGSPYGLEGSITVGIVSGTGRSLAGSTSRTIANVIQTDAAINPGNSGGPLLNSSGEVIGINTAIEVSSNGIGYCVPINTAKSLLPELLKGGEVKTAWLGISGVDIDADLVDTLKLPVASGVYVVGVTSGSPAEKAGIKGSGETAQGEPNTGGDIITAVDGKSVSRVEDMVAYFNTKIPGDKVTLTVNRNGQPQSIDVTLGEWPDNVTASRPQLPQIPTPTPNSEGGFDFGPFHFNWKDWKLPFPEPTQPAN